MNLAGPVENHSQEIKFHRYNFLAHNTEIILLRIIMQTNENKNTNVLNID